MPSSFTVSNKPRSLQIKFKVKTQKDEDQDVIVGQVNNVNTILTDEAEVLTATNQLKTKFSTTKTQMETNMNADLGNGISHTSNVFTELNNDLFSEPYIIGVKTNVHTKLNTAIDKAVETLDDYHTEQMAAAIALKDSKAATKAPKAVEENMHNYAVIISEAIDFGETYAGYDGIYKHTSFGIDLYAPELTPLVATVEPTMLTTGTNINYSVYGRCYVVNSLYRLIDSSNYVIREAGLTLTQLVNDFNARYYTSDLVRFAADLNQNFMASATPVPLDLPTIKEDPAGQISSTFSSTSLIYYSPLINRYMLRNVLFTPHRLYVIYNNDTSAPLESYNSSNPALLRFSQITASTSRTDRKFYYEITEFTDLIQILPGYQASLITDQDRILWNSVTNSYFVLVVKADTNKTNNAFTSQLQLLPLRTRYAYSFRNNVYKKGMTREELQQAGAMFYTEEFVPFHNSNSIPITADLSKRLYWVAKNRDFTFMTASSVQALASEKKTTYNKSQSIYYNAHLNVYTTLVPFAGDEVYAPLRNSTNGALIQGAGKTKDNFITENAFFVNDGTERIEINNGYQGYSGWSTIAHYPGMNLVFTGTVPVTTAPSSFILDTRTTTSITVKWTANVNATGYKIFVAKKSNSYPATPTATLGAVSTYSATGLDENTEYKFKIAAFNETGDGPYTADLNIFTLSSAAINNFAFGTITSSSIQVTFDAIASTGVDTFKIYYSELLDGNGDLASPTVKTIYLSTNANADETNTITEEDSKFKYTITGLTAGIIYHIQASIVLNSGETTKTAKLTKAVPMDLTNTRVTGVSVTDRTTSSITYSWDTVPTASSYKIFVAPIGESLPTEPTATVTTNTYMATSLLEYTGYNFNIVAVNELGDSLSLSSDFTAYTLSYTLIDGLLFNGNTRTEILFSFSVNHAFDPLLTADVDAFRIYFSQEVDDYNTPSILINETFTDVYKSGHPSANASNTVNVSGDGRIEYTITGLSANTVLFVQPALLFNGGQITRSNVLYAETETLPSMPAYDTEAGLTKLTTASIYSWQYFYSAYYETYAVRAIGSEHIYNSISGIARLVTSGHQPVTGAGKTRQQLYDSYYRANGDINNFSSNNDLENAGGEDANWVEIGTYEAVSGLNTLIRDGSVKQDFNNSQQTSKIWYNTTGDAYIWGVSATEDAPTRFYRFLEKNTDKVINALTEPTSPPEDIKNYFWFIMNSAYYPSDDVKNTDGSAIDVTSTGWQFITTPSGLEFTGE